ncbi:MATE family Na+-driven efflux transporter [Pseudobutyrivibrio ruminis]|uniref:Na+-driven multidrug efflux pump n=1 Tax=Pseudobutyrivibrio ruminis DSM 9787 TaxID=1123011 RepID=A0A285RJG7_9FIRM|nr:MATE family Na+-driven efflux transporter [Pseudobutyrivibrio ruminis]SOB92487.1 Na+-driven multidrug efflux pump [Pseudobutyrivibrio ruminis DSM 9787]
MLSKIKKSLSSIDYRLFVALLFMGLCPTLYTTLRTYFLGTLPGEWSYSIAGQLSWINLIYEVINEAIILPLYFFMGSALADKKKFANRIRSGLLISFGVYAICSILVATFINPLLNFMAVSTDILVESASYIRIECVANVFGILYSFMLVALVAIGKDRLVYIMTCAKLVMCIVLDTMLVSKLPISLKLGVNGIGISNCVSNLVLFVIAVLLIQSQGFPVLSKDKISFGWMRNFFKIGGISGLESFGRNIAYMLMVSRMVNMVGEQGTYWVANNFIWGWLLLPITQLAELIKQETAKDENAVKENTPGYFFITTITCLLWIVLIPVYKPFMHYVLGFDEVEKLFGLVMVLLGFYVLYAYQNIFDATFYGRGKTEYMLLESVVTNSIYYGLFFVLFITGAWTPTLIGIALMFGGGNAFDSVVSFLVYRYYRKNSCDFT